MIVASNQNFVEVPAEVLAARRHHGNSRPKTAGDALKLLKRRHPKLKKRPILHKNGNEISPTSVFSQKVLQPQHDKLGEQMQPDAAGKENAVQRRQLGMTLPKALNWLSRRSTAAQTLSTTQLGAQALA